MILLFGAGLTALLLFTLPFIGRVIVGPTLFDRVQALNGTGTIVPTIMIVLGLMLDRVDMLVDLALAMLLLNLFTTVLVARYVRDKAASE